MFVKLKLGARLGTGQLHYTFVGWYCFHCIYW